MLCIWIFLFTVSILSVISLNIVIAALSPCLVEPSWACSWLSLLLKLGPICMFLICQAVLGCILSCCTFRCWSLLYSSVECWWICFNRLINLMGQKLHTTRWQPKPRFSVVLSNWDELTCAPALHTCTHRFKAQPETWARIRHGNWGSPVWISLFQDYSLTLNSIFRQTACSFGV